MNIVPISQRDSKWAPELLGFNTSTYTIGGYGCLITCLAMVCNYYGKVETPSTINKKLKDVKGFSNGGFYIWGAVCKVFPDINEKWLGSFPDPLTNTQMDTIKQAIKDGRPVMVEIDFQPATAIPDQHFVLLIAYDLNDENNFTMADPWTGSIGSLKLYLSGTKPTARKSIQQIIVYNGIIPETPPIDWQDKYNELMNQYIGLKSQYDSLKEAFDNLQDKYTKDGQSAKEHIESLQSTVSEQSLQIQTMNETISQASVEKNSLLEANRALTLERVETLKKFETEVKYLTEERDRQTVRAEEDEQDIRDLEAQLKKGLLGYSRWERILSLLRG